MQLTDSAPDVSGKVGSVNLKSMTEILITKELKGSPMEGTAQDFIEAGEKYNVDPLFLVSIGYHESKYAKAYTNNDRHNYAGVMAFFNGQRDLRSYSSWKDAIYDHARIIREMYLDKGKTTIKQIWFSYAPPIEATNESWGPSVARKYNLLLSQFK